MQRRSLTGEMLPPRTKLANLCLLCESHHVIVHRQGWQTRSNSPAFVTALLCARRCAAAIVVVRRLVCASVSGTGGRWRSSRAAAAV